MNKITKAQQRIYFSVTELKASTILLNLDKVNYMNKT